MTDILTLTRPVQGLAVTAQSVPDMTVAVATGYALVANAAATAAAGNVTITTAHPTQDRIDAIVVDSAGAKSVIAGTVADGVNVQPPDTTGYTLLAYVYVLAQTHPSYTGTITSEAITDMRDFTEQPQQAQTFGYTFSTATTSTDPGTATLNFDSATANSITTMYINYTSATSPTSILKWLQQGVTSVGVSNPVVLRLRSRKNPANWIIFEALPTVTDHTTYGDVPVKHRGKSNTGTTVPLSTDQYDTILELVGPMPVTFENETAVLTGDVTMTLANTFYDGPAVSAINYVSGQTLFISGQITVIAGVLGDKITARIWNGTTTYVEGEITGSAVTAQTISLSTLIFPTSSQTYTIQAASTGTGGTIKAAVTSNSSGNLASKLCYVRIS